MFSTVMERVPIIRKINLEIEQYIKVLLQIKDYQMIDKLVYKLYGLAEEEIRFIENTNKTWKVLLVVGKITYK